ncbi:MAG: hypothetical protein U9Q66_04285, partial [Patescibacteria group bacterium]|nr:hypothetical protein [Patescibacteria group bacterium]
KSNNDNFVINSLISNNIKVLSTERLSCVDYNVDQLNCTPVDNDSTSDDVIVNTENNSSESSTNLVNNESNFTNEVDSIFKENNKIVLK